MEATRVSVSWSDPSLRPAAGDCGGGICSGAVGDYGGAGFGLGFAGAVGGAGADGVGAGGGIPVVDPLAPGIDGLFGGQSGGLPWAIVDLDFDGSDAAMLGPGDTGDGGAS